MLEEHLEEPAAGGPVDGAGDGVHAAWFGAEDVFEGEDVAEAEDTGEGFAGSAGGLIGEEFERAVEEPVRGRGVGAGEVGAGAVAEDDFCEEAADDFLAPEVAWDDLVFRDDIDFEAEAAGDFGDF